MAVRFRRVSVSYTYFNYLDVTGWDVWAHPTSDAQVADVLVTVNQCAATGQTAFKLIAACCMYFQCCYFNSHFSHDRFHKNSFILFTTESGKYNGEMSLPVRNQAENSNSSRFWAA